MPQIWKNFPEPFSRDVISIEMAESLKRFVIVTKFGQSEETLLLLLQELTVILMALND